MKLLDLEILTINKMASGHLCLEITKNVSWEDFPEYARDLIKMLKGQILNRVDAPDVRIWDVIISKRKYRLTFDDYPLMVSLESTNDEADSEINKIRAILQGARG